MDPTNFSLCTVHGLAIWAFVRVEVLVKHSKCFYRRVLFLFGHGTVAMTVNFTCASSKFAHLPDSRDLDVEAVLEMRGEIRSD
jgi:hypothetical protein